MATRKQPDEQAILFFVGMNNAQAAQGMLAWRWSREVFAPKARRVRSKTQVKAEMQMEQCCSSSPTMNPCTCEEQ